MCEYRSDHQLSDDLFTTVSGEHYISPWPAGLWLKHVTVNCSKTRYSHQRIIVNTTHRFIYSISSQLCHIWNKETMCCNCNITMHDNVSFLQKLTTIRTVTLSRYRSHSITVSITRLILSLDTRTSIHKKHQLQFLAAYTKRKCINFVIVSKVWLTMLRDR